ncbi:hypothetical protein IMF22_12230 [Pseudomonas poae]|uniref:Uncharacterized protein n=1 Tax=Pseudomonas poae TaxID=200451 RepID=A0A7M1KPG4_9PSED|nr:hypothetical protein [Pseudomonas poae]QOQ77738.1 hypothetical protein IMF22_12230 [Pseudomonas poae]
MSDKKVLSSFEVGTLAAITLIGTSLARLDVSKRTLISDAAQSLIEALPHDRDYSDGSSGNHLALRALIKGLHPVQSPQSSD